MKTLQKHIKWSNTVLNFLNKTYFSIGGGFIKEKNKKKERHSHKFPYDFKSFKDMLFQCKKNKFKIHELIMKNERSILKKKDVENNILKFWNVMEESIDAGIKSKGTLNGALKVKRRANEIYTTLKKS